MAKILSTEEEYSSMVYSILRCSGLQHDIWRCSLNPEDVQYLGIKTASGMMFYLVGLNTTHIHDIMTIELKTRLSGTTVK